MDKEVENVFIETNNESIYESNSESATKISDVDNGSNIKDTENRMSKWKRIVKNIWDKMTVEPLIFLHMVVYCSTEPVMENLYVDKSCLVTLQKSADICANLEEHHDDQIEVQKYSAKLEGAVTIIQNSIPVILLIYIGPLSDRYGRKLFLMWGLVTEMLSHIMFLLSSIFMDWPAYLTLIGPFLYSCGGALASIQMLMFICIADVTTAANRTFRLGILKICMNYGKPLGRLFGGAIFSVGGYIAVFGIAVILFLICLLYLAFMSETLSKEAMKKSELAHKGIKSIYEIPKSLIIAVCRKEGSRRSVVFWILVIHFVMFQAEKPPNFLLSRLMFNWDATDYSYWLFLKDFAAGTAMFVGVPIAIGYFGWTDAAVGITGSGSGALMYIAIGNVCNSNMLWLMILAPILGMWIPAGHLATRTILSKTACGPEELGKLFAVQGVLETAARVISGYMNASVYSATVAFFPETIFLVAASIFVICSYLFWLLDIFIQRREKEMTSQDKR